MCVGLTVVRRRFVLKKLFTKFLIVSVVMLIGLLMLSSNSGPPPKLGVNEGKLTPCPESPNCVSTQSDSQDHKMEPIAWKGTSEVAVSRIKETISRDFPGAALVEEGPGYLRYEFRSLIFRYSLSFGLARRSLRSGSQQISHEKDRCGLLRMTRGFDCQSNC